MSILTGKEIIKRVEKGDIFIEGFDPEKINPCSYNLCIGDRLMQYENEVVDCRESNPVKEIIIPEQGIILKKGEFYLARTKEKTITHNLQPMLEGRSSIARLGLFVHVSAGFGDPGFNGYWTLELYPTKDIKIYPNIPICQIWFSTIEGEVLEYKGKYQNNNGIQASKLYKDILE